VNSAKYSKIIFWRPRRLLPTRDIFRSWVVDVDGLPRGSLRGGKELSVDVLPGRHVLRAHPRWSWTGSPSHEIRVERDSVIRVRVEQAGSQGLFWRLLSRTRYLRLTIEQSPDTPD
jgi:hypothetical protein